ALAGAARHQPRPPEPRATTSATGGDRAHRAGLAREHGVVGRADPRAALRREDGGTHARVRVRADLADQRDRLRSVVLGARSRWTSTTDPADAPQAGLPVPPDGRTRF